MHPSKRTVEFVSCNKREGKKEKVTENRQETKRKIKERQSVAVN